MSSSSASNLHAKVWSIELILDVRNKSLNVQKRKWHSAFVAIYCSRAFLKPPVLKDININTKLLSRSPSYTTISVDDSVSVPDANGFRIDQTRLTELVKAKDLKQLQELGGVQGVGEALKTDVEHGIHGENAEDILKRIEAFGSNTYKRPPKKGFLHFVWEAFKDLTILILLGCAALSLGFGIKEHGLKEGWIDGGSIFLAIILVISVSAISNYRQSIQFDKLSKVSTTL